MRLAAAVRPRRPGEWASMSQHRSGGWSAPTNRMYVFVNRTIRYRLKNLNVSYKIVPCSVGSAVTSHDPRVRSDSTVYTVSGHVVCNGAWWRAWRTSGVHGPPAEGEASTRTEHPGPSYYFAKYTTRDFSATVGSQSELRAGARDWPPLA